MKISGIFFVLCSFLGCSVEQNIDTTKTKSITVSFYENHKLKETKIFGENSTQFHQVIGWLKENEKNWKPQFATIAPGTAIISGENFTLNIQQEFVTLNYEHVVGEYRQLVKPIEIGEFTFLPESNP
jgi:hypothetical protein